MTTRRQLQDRLDRAEREQLGVEQRTRRTRRVRLLRRWLATDFDDDVIGADPRERHAVAALALDLLRQPAHRELRRLDLERVGELTERQVHHALDQLEHDHGPPMIDEDIEQYVPARPERGPLRRLRREADRMLAANEPAVRAASPPTPDARLL